MFMLLMLSQSASGDDLSSLTSSEGFNYSFELKRPTMKSYSKLYVADVAQLIQVCSYDPVKMIIATSSSSSIITWL
jgi:hypothetical protein